MPGNKVEPEPSQLVRILTPDEYVDGIQNGTLKTN